VLIGISTAASGVILSAVWDIPSGPAIVLLATAIFFLSVIFSPKRLRRTVVS
jgi:ABC-type Mn2+/Zn2+ transport system permease subunit